MGLNYGAFILLKSTRCIQSSIQDGECPTLMLGRLKVSLSKKQKMFASKKYSIPSNLLELGKSKQSAFLTLKLVEIIGEDEAYNLDPETIYFITHLLNQNNLKKIRNEILISALPQRS